MSSFSSDLFCFVFLAGCSVLNAHSFVFFGISAWSNMRTLVFHCWLALGSNSPIKIEYVPDSWKCSSPVFLSHFVIVWLHCLAYDALLPSHYLSWVVVVFEDVFVETLKFVFHTFACWWRCFSICSLCCLQTVCELWFWRLSPVFMEENTDSPTIEGLFRM